MQAKYPTYRHIMEYMRVNLVVGAKTGEHTDTMRGPTPNFMLIEPYDGEKTDFILRVRLFPKFRTSVVSYHGKLFIPHMYCPSELIMIGFNEGKAHYYQFKPEALEDLKPHGEFGDWIVVGIVKGKLQVCPWKYATHLTTKSLPLMKMEDIVDAAVPKVKITKRFKYVSTTSKYIKFNGWQLIHRWVEGSNHLGRRIHIFFRPIREETAAARLRTKTSTTKEPINYTIVE